MTRLARRRLLTIAATTAAVLVAPAAASAATYTVKTGDGACGSGDVACGGLAEAATAINAGTGGDTINISAGAYPGATFNVGGLTINGAAGVLITSKVEFTAGAYSTMAKVAVAQTGGVDAIRVSGTSAGLQLSDAVVVSQGANGVLITSGASNKIVRSVITSGTGPSAIRVTATSGAAPELTADSTIASGGTAGIGAVTTAGLTPGGSITMTLRHVSAYGTTNGILLDASAGSALGGGNITATMTNSIAFNNATKTYVGLLNLGNNTATLTTTGPNLTTGTAAATFANPAGFDLRLRPDAVDAIGKGGVTAGESATDFEGEDRAAAPTDLGADEFNNAAPVAKVAVATKVPRATQPVRFDGAGSVDREATFGGGITAYQWTFSDGATQTTSTATVDHAFAKEGAANASLVVVDKQGASSAPAAVSLSLIDGTAPVVAIIKPTNKQAIKRFKTKTTTKTVNGKKVKTKKKTRTKIVFGGLSKDANGVAAVILTFEKLAVAAPKDTGAKASQAAAAKCVWYNPAKGFTRKSCGAPVFITAALKKDSKTGEWGYTVKRNLSVGSYRLSAIGVDKTGAVGNSGGTKFGVVKFTVK